MKNASLVLNHPTMDFVESELFPGDGCESGAIITLGINDSSESPNGPERRYLSHQIEMIPQSDIALQSRQQFAWRKQTFLRVLKQARAAGMAIGFVHSHRGVPAYFSEADDRNDSDVAELVRNRTSGAVDYVSIVVDEQGNAVARSFAGGQSAVMARVCGLLGRRWKWCFLESRPYDGTPYDRQVLAFGPEFLSALRHIRIGVVGAGATGSATSVLLARNGAADIHPFDPDVVDHTNLSRLHGATVADADVNAPKVNVLASHIEGFGLGTSVTPHQLCVTDPRARNILKSCDLIFGCTDDHAGRVFLNRFSYFYNIPFVDMGIAIDPERIREGFIRSADARVTVLYPGSPCLVCRRVVNLIKARDEQLFRDDPNEYERRRAVGYVSGQDVPNPAVITLTTAVACMAVDELTARMTGYRETIDNRVRKYRLNRDTRPGAHAGCGVCGSPDYWGRGDMTPFMDRVG